MVSRSFLWGRKKMVIRALIALLLLVAPASADEFQITTPQSLATVTMPCWQDRKLSEAMTRAEFDPITHGLIVKKTDPAQPLVTFWIHMLTGRGMVSLSRPEGEECILAVLESAQ